MAADNQTTIVGNLVETPELRFTNNGSPSRTCAWRSLSGSSSGCAVLPAPDREWLHIGSGSTEDCPGPTSACPPRVPARPRERCRHAGDRRRPHKASHTAPALDEHGQLLDRQRISTTLDGYQQLRQWAGRSPQRCWAVEGAHGIAEPQLSGWSVTANKWWTCWPSWPPGSGCCQSPRPQERPDDAVSVAIASQSASQLRQVGVEDQAVVLHLLTSGGARIWSPPAPRPSTGSTGC